MQEGNQLSGMHLASHDGSSLHYSRTGKETRLWYDNVTWGSSRRRRADAMPWSAVMMVPPAPMRVHRKGEFRDIGAADMKLSWRGGKSVNIGSEGEPDFCGEKIYGSV